ncbi:hypothetical protein NIES208_16745 [[Limnothrix rosea] IAM M-220]|nr:hypothetical protein NIES208_16745 [[Limnothrix rosea] IAM M-220]
MLYKAFLSPFPLEANVIIAIYLWESKFYANVSFFKLISRFFTRHLTFLVGKIEITVFYFFIP